MSDYSNTIYTRVSSGGGHATLTIASNYAISSSIPCREVYAQAAATNAGSVAVSFSSTVSLLGGMRLTKASNTSGQPLRIPVDDVNRLHFYGTNDGDKVIVMYRK